MNALTQGEDAMMRQFLTDLWGDLPGQAIIAKLIKWTDKATAEEKSSFKHFYPATIDDTIKQAQRLDADGADAYFAMSLFRDVNVKSNTGNRIGTKAIGARSFWMDIDCGEAKVAERKGYLTPHDGAMALKSFCKSVGLPKPTYIVSSGYGLHVYWVFDRLIPAAKWREAGRKLKSLTKQRGFLVDPSRTGEIASVLRVPGTRNFKDRENPKPVKIEHAGRVVDLDAFTAALDAALPDAKRAADAALGQIESNLTRPPPPETPEEIAKVRSQLDAIPPDVGRDEWVRAVWALQATGWSCAKQLAREWSQRGVKWDEDDFEGVVKSFKPDGGITFGTLDFIARKHGWTPPTVVTVAPQSTAAPTQVEIVGARADRGDVLNGEVFARQNRGRLLFIAETKQWLEFDPESGWLKAKEGEEDRAAKAVLDKLARYAAKKWADNPKDGEAQKLLVHVEKSHALPRLRAMIELAKSEPGMTARLSDFDADPWLLGVANGVLNLKTGDLMPMSPDVRVSKRANVAFDPHADCPQWKKFVREVQPDVEARAFLRRLCGYFLSGIVAEHIFPFISGEGGNGKGVFVETVAHVLGDYAVKIETAMLMEHKRSPQAASPDLMKLRGARLGYCSETSEGQRLDAARVKEMSGGDTLTARPLYGHPVTFEPSHKLLMMGNYRPEVNDNSAGMWRRIILIPFDMEIPKDQQDPRLPERLGCESSGILNWALAGLRDWRKGGLQIPERIGRETDAYRDENDLLSQWVHEDCELGAGCSERKHALYFSYAQWCEHNGLHPLAQPRFTRRLRKQHRLELASDERTITGVRLKKSRGNI